MQTRWPRKDVNGCVRLTQPNVSTEEMPVTTKLPCYPAHEGIIEDRPLEKNITILVTVTMSGLPAEILRFILPFKEDAEVKV